MTRTPRYEDYKIIDKFTGGVQGRTYLAQEIETEKYVVMKIVEYFEAEEKMRARQEDRNELYIICEYCVGGDLSKYTEKFQKLSDTEKNQHAIIIASQLIAGMTLMHDNGIMHRDLKPKNIFMDADGNIKIESTNLLSSSLPIVLLLPAIAGVLYRLRIAEKLQEESDIVTQNIIRDGNEADQEDSFFTLSLDDYAKNDVLNSIKKYKLRNKLPDWVCPELRGLILGLMNQNQLKRLSFRDAIQYPLVQNYLQSQGYDEQDKEYENDNIEQRQINERSETVNYQVEGIQQQSEISKVKEKDNNENQQQKKRNRENLQEQEAIKLEKLKDNEQINNNNNELNVDFDNGVIDINSKNRWTECKTQTEVSIQTQLWKKEYSESFKDGQLKKDVDKQKPKVQLRPMIFGQVKIPQTKPQQLSQIQSDSSPIVSIDSSKDVST
ncbi:MAG: hypothetical protein EZS28_004150 [Streblomastix strix]|uniref:Protein kinase domain-containing protein n=1 Tax=Streblomastix strix TaxID=222440 RepID=A0A5J4X1L2_9EUKA|nr:MAG: hypothetical protein EZS28_004150 [Streblomastix strix]